MSSAISYPHYSPKARDLRGYLLFYENISTIVPNCDQSGVMHREEIYELNEVSNGEALSFYDPSMYSESCLDGRSTKKQLKKLIKLRKRKKKNIYIANTVKIDGDGYLQSDQNYDLCEKLLKDAGWRYIAQQKSALGLLEQLIDLKLACRVNAIPSESLPILMDSHLCDFILARLTREIATIENVASISSLKKDVSSFLLDDDISVPQKRSEILSLTLDIAIPSEIDKIPAGDFWEIRDEFTDARLNMNIMMDELALQLDLDSVSKAKDFKQRLEQHVSELSTRIDKAHKNIGRRRFSSLAIDMFCGAVGSATGFSLDSVGSAAVVGAIAPVVSSISQNISTKLTPYDSNSIEQIAAIRSKVEKNIRKATYSRSHYRL